MIEAKNLSYYYDKKDKHAISDVFFHVNEGEVFAILGQKDAGKTTIVNLLAGIFKIQKGDISIDEYSIKRNNKYLSKIGVVFKSPRFYNRFTAKQNLKFFSRLYDKKCGDIDALLDRLMLADDVRKKVHTYTPSMLKRLALARALLADPKVLILDEPTYGVDDYTASLIRDIILHQKKQGKCVLFTTADGLFAKKTCDRVAFLVNGRIKKITSPVDFDKKGKLIDVSYYYKRDVITHIIDTNNMSDRELLANIIRRNDLRTVHSNEHTLGDVLDYLSQKDAP